MRPATKAEVCSLLRFAVASLETAGDSDADAFGAVLDDIDSARNLVCDHYEALLREDSNMVTIK